VFWEIRPEAAKEHLWTLHIHSLDSFKEKARYLKVPLDNPPDRRQRPPSIFDWFLE